MRRRRHRRRHRRRVAPSTSIAGYTRALTLRTSTVANGQTTLATLDVPDVSHLTQETTNRKIVRIAGQCMFAANLAADRSIFAQFCLWAHPEQEDWPAIADYDPFSEGPGEAGFEGMLAPRTFCRRTFVLTTPFGGVTEVVQNAHTIRSKAERLLRPGWRLSAGLYVRGSDVGITCTHASMLRYVVAG